MDPLERSLLLILAATTALALLVTVKRRGRTGLPFAALLVGELGLLTLSISRGEASPFWVYAALAGFAWLLLLPALLLGLSRRLLRTGRVRAAFLLQRVRAVMQPGTGQGVEQQLLSSLTLVREGRLSEAVSETQAELARATDETVRLVLVERLLVLYLYDRRFGEVVAQFERHGGMPLAEAAPGIATTMVRAYAELGELELAAHCQWVVERHPAAVEGSAAEVVNGARLCLLAHLGRVEEVSKLLDPASGFMPELSEARRMLWLGVALARSGGAEEATALWRTVVEVGADGEAVEAARRRLESPPPSLAPPEDEGVEELVRIVTERAGAHHRVPRNAKRVWRAAPVTTALLVVLAAIHVGVELQGSAERAWVLWRFGANFRLAAFHGEPWRLLASMFLHGGLLHLAFNLYALYLLGRLVEQLYGSLRFWTIYMGAGLAGALASAVYGGDERLSVGASGAIFGLLGAALVGVRRLRGQVPEAWRKELTMNLLISVGLQLYIGFTVPMIDNAAHVGGLVGGGAVALLLALPKVATLPAARQALILLAVIWGGATAASAVMVSVTGPAQTLARLPGRNLVGSGVVARIPRHWVELRGQAGTMVQDPLLEDIYPTWQMLAPEGLSEPGTPLAEVVREYLAALRRAETRSNPGAAAGPEPHQRALHPDLIEVERRVVVDGQPAVELIYFRRQTDLLLVGRSRLPPARLATYRALLERVGRSLSLAERGGQRSVQPPGT
ncbi:MAG: rhomboid family intramembrane serine protease [Deltaproteobacteria bacterium]|nr:rhomboid family intramembrane serine protease [Deltaproteobacteria bacterium]